MSLSVRKTLPHAPPETVRSDTATFFITICCQQRDINQLCASPVSSVLFETARFRHSRGDWWLDVILLMPDHIHLLASFPGAKVLPAVIKEWKSYTAKAAGIQWERDYFDHRLRHEESWRDKVDYILNNPVRKGLVARAQDWPHVWIPGRDEPPARPSREN